MGRSQLSGTWEVYNPCPNPAGDSLPQPGVTLPQPLTQAIVARFLISKVTKNLVKYILSDV